MARFVLPNCSQQAAPRCGLTWGSGPPDLLLLLFCPPNCAAHHQLPQHFLADSQVVANLLRLLRARGLGPGHSWDDLEAALLQLLSDPGMQPGWLAHPLELPELLRLLRLEFYELADIYGDLQYWTNLDHWASCLQCNSTVAIGWRSSCAVCLGSYCKRCRDDYPHLQTFHDVPQKRGCTFCRLHLPAALPGAQDTVQPPPPHLCALDTVLLAQQQARALLRARGRGRGGRGGRTGGAGGSGSSSSGAKLVDPDAVVPAPHPDPKVERAWQPVLQKAQLRLQGRPLLSFNAKGAMNEELLHGLPLTYIHQPHEDIAQLLDCSGVTHIHGEGVGRQLLRYWRPLAREAWDSEEHEVLRAESLQQASQGEAVRTATVSWGGGEGAVQHLWALVLQEA
jgi:hypothetical protein